MIFHIFLLIFCQEVRSDEPSTIPIEPISTSRTITTTTAATTTTSSLYCGADKCDRHSILIYDLEQKFKQLQNDTSDLRNEVEILKKDNEVLKEENEKLKNENEVLKEDVKQLQGLG